MSEQKLTYTETPYLRDILESLDPNAPANWVVVKKGASIGFSSCVIDSAMGYILSSEPMPLVSHHGINTKRLDDIISRSSIRPKMNTTLQDAGFSPEEIKLCDKRFRASGNQFSYALNSTVPAEDMGMAPLDGNVVINAMLATKKGKKKKFSLGSYKKH